MQREEDATHHIRRSLHRPPSLPSIEIPSLLVVRDLLVRSNVDLLTLVELVLSLKDRKSEGGKKSDFDARRAREVEKEKLTFR